MPVKRFVSGHGPSASLRASFQPCRKTTLMSCHHEERYGAERPSATRDLLFATWHDTAGVQAQSDDISERGESELPRGKNPMMKASKPSSTELNGKRGTIFYPLSTNHYPLRYLSSCKVKSLPISPCGSRSYRENLRNLMILKNHQWEGVCHFHVSGLEFQVGEPALERQNRPIPGVARCATTCNLKLQLTPGPVARWRSPPAPIPGWRAACASCWPLA